VEVVEDEDYCRGGMNGGRGRFHYEEEVVQSVEIITKTKYLTRWVEGTTVKDCSALPI
jgi:hypothetical protein